MLLLFYMDICPSLTPPPPTHTHTHIYVFEHFPKSAKDNPPNIPAKDNLRAAINHQSLPFHFAAKILYEITKIFS